MFFFFFVEKQNSFRIDRLLDIFYKNPASISEIEYFLNLKGPVNSRNHSSIDFDTIRNKLKDLTELMNTIDQIDVAQLVARHLCTRYRSQLICLAFDNNENLHLTFSEEKTSAFSCCSKPKESRDLSVVSSTKVSSIDRLVNFAIAFVIDSINKDDYQRPQTQKTSRKDHLATRLVLMITQAAPDNTLKYPRQVFSLPIDQKAVNRVRL